MRPKGLGFDEAARRLAYLLTMARQLGFSGVNLEDESDRFLPE